MALIILAACSGTGKSTLAEALIQRHARLRISVSHTTRSPRPGEVNGRHYHFKSEAEFEAMIEAEGFVEWARYAGNLYGTAHETIQAAEAAGEDLLFDIDIVGAANLKRAYPEARACFILPPSWETVEARLRGRGTEDEATIQRRLATGREELMAAERFDHLVINDQLEEALEALDAIYLSSQSLTAHQRTHLDQVIAESRL